MAATLDELRELSRRSLRAQRWTTLAMLGTLALFPALALAWTARPDAFVAATWGATALAGALFVATAFVTGQARGAFRKVMRRVKKESRAARRLVPSAPAKEEITR